MADLNRVVIVGGGVGGLTSALALKNAGVEVEAHEKYDHLAGPSLIEELPVGEMSRTLGAPSCDVRRRDMQKALIELVGEGNVKMARRSSGSSKRTAKPQSSWPAASARVAIW